MPSVEGLLLALLFLMAACLLTFVLSVIQGAGTPIGEAGISEAAPWVARAIPRLLIRILLFRRPVACADLSRELDSLVDHAFLEKHTAAERSGAMIRVFMESISLIRQARRVQMVPAPRVVIRDGATSLTKTVKIKSGKYPLKYFVSRLRSLDPELRRELLLRWNESGHGRYSLPTAEVRVYESGQVVMYGVDGRHVYVNVDDGQLFRDSFEHNDEQPSPE